MHASQAEYQVGSAKIEEEMMEINGKGVHVCMHLRGYAGGGVPEATERRPPISLAKCMHNCTPSQVRLAVGKPLDSPVIVYRVECRLL